MACIFLTAAEALEYANSLNDDEIEMANIPPNPDFVSDEEKIDKSDTKQPVMCHESDIPDTILTIDILVNHSKELHLSIKKQSG